jgi:purine-binding chemotaxis protein CheW
LADSVREVLDINPDQIEPPPRLGTKLNTDFIQGMGNCNDEFVIILDIDKVFSVEELSLVQGMTSDNKSDEQG